MVPHDFISLNLKKLQEAESLPFCPTDAAFFLLQCSLHTRDGTTYILHFLLVAGPQKPQTLTASKHKYKIFGPKIQVSLENSTTKITLLGKAQKFN